MPASVKYKFLKDYSF